MFTLGWTRFFSAGRGEKLSPEMYFSSLPVLQTERLILRPLRRKDTSDIFSYASDPEVTRYVLWDPHRSVSETRGYIRYILALYRRGLPSSARSQSGRPRNGNSFPPRSPARR